MYELVQVSEKCYYINCPAKIGVYVADKEQFGYTVQKAAV